MDTRERSAAEKNGEREEASAPARERTPSLTDRASYAFGRWLAVPADRDQEFVLA